MVAEAGFSVDIRDVGVGGWFPTVSASVEVSLSDQTFSCGWRAGWSKKPSSYRLPAICANLPKIQGSPATEMPQGQGAARLPGHQLSSACGRLHRIRRLRGERSRDQPMPPPPTPEPGTNRSVPKYWKPSPFPSYFHLGLWKTSLGVSSWARTGPLRTTLCGSSSRFSLKQGT